MKALLRMTNDEVGNAMRCHAEILLGCAPPDSSEYWADWQGDQLEADREKNRRKQRARRARRQKDVSASPMYPGYTGGTNPGTTRPPTTTNAQNLSSLSDPVSSPSKPLSQNLQYVAHGKGQQSLDTDNVNGVEYTLGLWKKDEPWTLLGTEDLARKAKVLTDGLDKDLIRRLTNKVEGRWRAQSHQKRTGAKRSTEATLSWIGTIWGVNIPWCIENRARELAAAKTGVTVKSRPSEDGAKEIPTVDHSKYYYPGEEPGT